MLTRPTDKFFDVFYVEGGNTFYAVNGKSILNYRHTKTNQNN